MLLYALRRVALALPLLIGITFISFFVIQLAPGGPFDFLINPDLGKIDPKIIQALQAEFGLDQPLHNQYWNWLERIAVLDFGRSFAPARQPGLRDCNGEYLSFWKQQRDFGAHLNLPITVATFGGLAGFSRYMRQSMLEVVRQEDIQTA